MFVADAHCDTIGEMYLPLNLYKSKGQLDLKRMSEYDGWLQIFAVWINPENETEFLRKRFGDIKEKFLYQLEENKNIVHLAKSGEEIKKALQRYKCVGVLAVEGGEIIGKDLDYIDFLYNSGVRIITLTWNYENAIGCGADCTEDKGLTEFGKCVLKRMNEKNIIADLSHSSERTFWDVAEASSRAFMTSHSNVKALCCHRRNLTDEQIMHIIKINGFIGVNYFPPFLNDSKKAGIDDVLKHIEYFMDLGAKDVLGLGSDFDGIDFAPRGIDGAQSVYKIAEALLKHNYSEYAVKKIMGENLKNFLIREMKNGENYE